MNSAKVKRKRKRKKTKKHGHEGRGHRRGGQSHTTAGSADPARWPGPASLSASASPAPPRGAPAPSAEPGPDRPQRTSSRWPRPGEPPRRAVPRRAHRATATRPAPVRDTVTVGGEVEERRECRHACAPASPSWSPCPRAAASPCTRPCAGRPCPDLHPCPSVCDRRWAGGPCSLLQRPPASQAPGYAMLACWRCQRREDLWWKVI
ncbi:unnamed protein product [Urochloa humidicola]